ncbi:MAG: asparagine synthase C-terminal domain-containing protein [Dysgonamonadaceae bacterium]|jgi:asparagine synthase (glutamine-hydrolysing)|nr:asparagine synthase C-terminal domain-containing protein [Dysgonamonadaceae bacterium]
MINIQLVHNKGYKWFSNNGSVWVKGFVFTPENGLLKEEKLIDYFTGTESFDAFQAKLKTANGLFSVVIRQENGIWAAIDHARSFPLFYYHGNDDFFLTDNPDELAKENIPTILDEESAVLFRHSGFAAGNRTLLKNIFQLIAGQSLCCEENRIKTEFHTEFLTDTFFTQTREELKTHLKSTLEHVGRRLVEALAGRPAVIPLSGGFDSRLMAYLLRKYNYTNVICYTFGKKDNIEVNNALRTAENLGYEFYFIDYGKYRYQMLADDPDFRAYVDYSAAYACRPEDQDYCAIKEMMKQGQLAAGAVFIPGHSGAVAGHLLFPSMDNPNFSWIEHAVDEVYSQASPNKREMRIVRENIHFLDRQPAYPAFLLYENWRFQGTTALAFNTAKMGDFFGFEYLLPLWDRELFSFFMHTPFRHKYDKNLYKETLSELFREFNIYFGEDELYPNEKLVRKVAFRSKLKKRFPFLKRFVNVWKNDITGEQNRAAEFARELEEGGISSKRMPYNSILSAWYVLHVRKKLERKK